jgi:uncharacterized protein
MSLTVNLLDIPSGGLQIQDEIEPSALSLSPDEGMVLGSLRCLGESFLTGERSAYFQGVISGRVSRECVRCLIIFQEFLSLPCEAEFQKPANTIIPGSAKSKGPKGYAAVSEEDVPDEDVYPIMGNEIDLLPAIREHVILATPFQVLCREDCLGLCQVCGANLNEGMCGCCTPVTPSSSAVSFQTPVSRQNQPTRFSVTVPRRS